MVNADTSMGESTSVVVVADVEDCGVEELSAPNIGADEDPECRGVDVEATTVGGF